MVLISADFLNDLRAQLATQLEAGGFALGTIDRSDVEELLRVYCNVKKRLIRAVSRPVYRSRQLLAKMLRSELAAIVESIASKSEHGESPVLRSIRFGAVSRPRRTARPHFSDRHPPPSAW